MDVQRDYARRRTDAATAAGRIAAGSKVAIALTAAQPPALMAALAARARAGEVGGLKLYYMLSGKAAGETVLAPDLADRIRPMSVFNSAVERALDGGRIAAGQAAVDFLPSNFSQVPRLLADHVGIDVLLTTVSPMDAEGNFSLGTNTDYALAVARSGARLIVEVNPNMPYVRGDCMIPLSRIEALVETASPIPAAAPPPPGPVDRQIGAIVAGLAGDGACLQMGIGALPDAVCAALAGHRHLGIHTEMMGPGLARLIEAGVVDNSRKQSHAGISVFAFAMGDEALYRFLDHHPAIETWPVDYVNAPHVIARNDNVLSVNATVEIDLHGACNSESLGGRQFSGTGGQLDFVRGAYASRGGKSIIACHSTAAKGTVSRIVPRLSGPVTTPRTDVHIIVTEHGWADMKGKSLGERARALIDLAHPDFREPLERAAHGEGLLPTLVAGG